MTATKTSKRFFYSYTRVPDDRYGRDWRGPGSWVPDDELIFEVGSFSTPAAKRPLLARLLAVLQPGDSVAFGGMQCLGCSATDILRTLDLLLSRQIGVYLGNTWLRPLPRHGHSYDVLSTLEALSRIEKGIENNRIERGVSAAARSGKRVGRPGAPALDGKAALQQVLSMLEQGKTVTAVAEAFGVHRRSIQRLLQKNADISAVEGHRVPGETVDAWAAPLPQGISVPGRRGRRANGAAYALD